MGVSSAVGLVALVLLLVATFVHASPMMYKKNDQSKYEADLIPVSSTVIPLSVYEVSYGSSDGKISEEEYKRIYMKHMHKKAHQYHQPGILDKLVTAKPALKKE